MIFNGHLGPSKVRVVAHSRGVVLASLEEPQIVRLAHC